MKNLIIIFILLIIVGLASGYIIKAKKRGAKCIGCPYANSCGAKKAECACGAKANVNKK